MGKNKKKPLNLLLIAIVFLSFFSSPQPAIALQAYPHTDLTDRVDELFRQWDRSDSHARGYGIANLEYSLPWTPQTPSRTGSISKQFVGMCIAILAEQGKLSLDDTVRQYFPEWPDYGDEITIKHLLYHTSGIREYLTLVDLMGKPEGSGYVYTPNELVRTLSRQKELNFKPGEMFSYSNSGYFLLSEIVKKVTGQETSTFAELNVFEPLGMANSHFHDDPNRIVRNRAYGYSPKKEDGFRIDILRLRVIGDLGVFSTIEDFHRWDQNFYDNKLGNGTQKLIDTMLTTGKLTNESELSYAFGLRISNYRGLSTISHGGSAVGYQAQFMQFPRHRFSVAILSNLSNFPTGRIARQIADLYLAEQFTEAAAVRERPNRTLPEPISVPVSQLEEHGGKYYSEELDVLYALRVEKGELELELRETLYALTPFAVDRFGLRGSELRFARDQEGRITGFTIEEGIVKNLKFVKVNGE